MILVVHCGSPGPEVVAARGGDFPAWFQRGLAAPVEAVAPFAGEALPDLGAAVRRYRGVVISGSPLSVRDEAPWMARLGRWAVEAARLGLPVLGGCFGHQLLAEALGGRVEPSPRGPEYGTTPVHLTPEGQADPLFAGLPELLLVQETHGDAVVRPPPGAVRLAGTDRVPWQAFAWGPHLRGVQFHPEMTALDVRALLDRWGIAAAVSESPHGRRVLANWYAMTAPRPAD